MSKSTRNKRTAEKNSRGSWQGPRKTPSGLGIDTPLAYLNESWNIAVDLVDRGRDLYYRGKGMGTTPDSPDGYPGAWTPTSFGRRVPIVYPWDERDNRHTAKMINYLWAGEPGLAREYERNVFIDRILDNGDYLDHDGTVMPYVVIPAMYCSVAADVPRYLGLRPRGRGRVLANAEKFVRRMIEKYDPEESGLLSVGVGPDWHSRGFWGAHLGEPNHYPANYDGRAKTVISTMTFAILVKRLCETAAAVDAPETKFFNTVYQRLKQAIEGKAWNERTGYYYLQYDPNTDRWFHSMNGLCEESRETEIMPAYSAEIGDMPERIRAVGRVLDHVLCRERVFPMPTRFPAYAWYSPEHPNYADTGDYGGGPMAGAWDTPYFHCVQLLERLGLQEAIQRAVFRRAEVIHRDQDCQESYRLDGTVDHTRFYNRDRYFVSATSHLAAIIEGLFGVTPAGIAFKEINIRPNLPLYRRHRHSTHLSDWSGRDNKLQVLLGGNNRRLNLVIRYDEDVEVLTLETNKLGIMAHIRLPLDLAARFKRATWSGKPIRARVEQGMDSDFVHVDHCLDGGRLRVELAPHPAKGKGSTPYIDPRPEQ